MRDRLAERLLHGSGQQLLAEIGLDRGKVADNREIGSGDGCAQFCQRFGMRGGDKIAQFPAKGVLVSLRWPRMDQPGLVACD